MGLIASLWTNYRLPANDGEMRPAVLAWSQFFASVPQREVIRTIMEISAEGGEFAPQVGQIYARLKAGRLEKNAGRKSAEDSGGKLRRWYCEWADECHKKGCKTYAEARRSGVSVAENAERLREAGL